MQLIERASRARSKLSTAFATASLVAAALLAGGAHSARAQGGLLLQGVADGEFWSTNATSNLLTRNAGSPTGLARLQVWGAYEPLSHWVIYAQGEAEAGKARNVDETNDVYSNQFGIRYAAHPAFVVDVGRLTPVIGTFSSRRFSTRNPLIGIPDGYSLQYPLGAEVSGEIRHFDYRAAMVSLPADHVEYEPNPTPRLRPAIGGGYTPFTGARIGASFTEGPYLNRSLTPIQLAGRDWSAYHQRVIALDATFSRGYLETHAEFARGTYDLPDRTSAATGVTYYGEVKYTFTPRFFLATRVERNRYPFIRPTAGSAWIANITDFVDGEFGAGYRASASTVLKVSLRGDRWWVRPGASGFRGLGGHAIAVQWSQAFDALSWFERGQ
jgi:hypothetical protein